MEKSRELMQKMIKICVEKIYPYLAIESSNLMNRIISLSIENIPKIEAILMEGIEIMFAPRQLIKQLVIVTAVQLLIMAGKAVTDLGSSLVVFLSSAEREQKRLINELSKASSYQGWMTIAERLDYMRGNDKWRLEDESSLYDCKVIKKRIDDTLEMIKQGNVFTLMFRLRGGLARDQYGMQHEGLFSRAITGTKRIVERYHGTVAYALNFICDSEIEGEEIPVDAKLAFFNETRHAYGRSALLLSGGAYLGFYHIGVVKALLSEGLLPRVISGASAGSLIAAMVGTRRDAELEKLVDANSVFGRSIRRDYFLQHSVIHSPTGQLFQKLIPSSVKWLFDPILALLFDFKLVNLDTEHFKQAVRQNVGEFTFQEAFDKTGRIINITVAPSNNYDPPRLLNYLTAPHVCIWSAACASCAVPGLFDSITLIVKEPNGIFRPENEWTRQAHIETASGTKVGNYTDGSIESDLPMLQLSELFNVNHFIVSQVNAHSALFSSMSHRATVWSSSLYGSLVGIQRFLKAMLRDWLKNFVDLMIYRSNAPIWSAKRGLHQMLTQDYEGREVDIMITPWTAHLSLFNACRSVIKNPTETEYSDAMDAGEAATWPSICRIRAHCHVEMTLDQCVQRLRLRVALDESHGIEKEPAEASETGEEPANPRIKDRTPSFFTDGPGTAHIKKNPYTSRSIITLSGLSVSDPFPDMNRGLYRTSSDGIASKNPQKPRRIRRESKEKLLKNSSFTGSVDSQGSSVDTREGTIFTDVPSKNSKFPKLLIPKSGSANFNSLKASGSSGIGWGLEGLGGSDDGLNESLISSFVPLVTTQKSPRDKFKYSNDIQGSPSSTHSSTRKPFGTPQSPAKAAKKERELKRRSGSINSTGSGKNGENEENNDDLSQEKSSSEPGKLTKEHSSRWLKWSSLTPFNAAGDSDCKAMPNNSDSKTALISAATVGNSMGTGIDDDKNSMNVSDQESLHQEPPLQMVVTNVVKKWEPIAHPDTCPFPRTFDRDPLSMSVESSDVPLKGEEEYMTLLTTGRRTVDSEVKGDEKGCVGSETDHVDGTEKIDDEDDDSNGDSDEDNDDDDDDDEEDDENEEQVPRFINRTISMSNFYYKHKEHP